MPSILLMENAGRAVADLLLRKTKGRVVVCCGKGNNGGDGFVIARHLDNAGISAEVLLFAEPATITGDAEIMLKILQHTSVPVLGPNPIPELASRLSDCDWVVDALFGTGLSGPARPPFVAAIEAINGSGKPIFAVDIPSGLDCDTGQPIGATIRATVTGTLVAQKKGFAAPEAKPYLGEVQVLDIGAPRTLLEKYATPP